MRAGKPQLDHVWKQWEEILSKPLGDIAAAILGDDTKGGLLRAYSPLGAALNPVERNAIWRRIGLGQFVRYFLDAAADLGLTTAEQAQITGVDEDELVQWEGSGPTTMHAPKLDPLKQLVAIHRSLLRLFPDMEARRDWLRTPHETLEAAPIDLLLQGDMATVQHHVMRAVQPSLGRKDVPSH